jgi:hypothetical protein
MRHVLRARLLLTAALAAFLVLALWPAAAAGHGRQVTVMTRNLFVGTDLTPIFTAQTLPQLVGATTTAFLEVQATRFPERAQAIADEIAATQPDVVGLQEAMLIRTDAPRGRAGDRSHSLGTLPFGPRGRRGDASPGALRPSA